MLLSPHASWVRRFDEPLGQRSCAATPNPKLQTLSPNFPEPTKFDPKPTALGDGSAEMLAVAYAPDGELLATGGADGVVCLWELIP